MNSEESCPICGAGPLAPAFEIPGLSVARCIDCGHGVARQFPPTGSAEDYHAQYDGGSFLDALRETRERQAAVVIQAIRRHLPCAGHLLDFGAGRGWFLEACRRKGIAPIAGADASELAVAGLRRAGFEAHLLPGADARPGTGLGALSFRPRVLTLLDVLEHFPPEEVAATLRKALDECPDLELVVVKVPVPGLLHGLAQLLSRVGLPGPIRQLYQVGTWPPHLSYFSERSMETLLEGAGLALLERFGDTDFEPGRLAARMGADRRIFATVVHVAGSGLHLAIRASGGFDSAIFVAKPAPSAARLRAGRPGNQPDRSPIAAPR